MRSLVEATGRPLSMTVQQPEPLPDRWREMAAWVDACVAAGLPLKTQVAARPIGVLQGLTASVNPLVLCPSFRQIADLPLPEMVAALRDPERRQRIVDEHDASKVDGILTELVGGFHKLFPMNDPVDYEPPASASIAATGGLGSRSGRGRAGSVGRARRQPAAVHAAVQLRQRQPRRCARDAADTQRAHGSQRRGRALRCDQRRQHDHHGAGAVDPRSPGGARCRSS